MTQAELNRAVSRATGETVTTVRELGFELADPDVVRHDPEPSNSAPTDLDFRVVDFDALAVQRQVAVA